MSSKVSECLKEHRAAASDNSFSDERLGESYRVACGLMLLPCHLQEDLHLFIKEYPVCDSIITIIKINPSFLGYNLLSA